MPALVAGIHVLRPIRRKGADGRPAMTKSKWQVFAGIGGQITGGL
jgi:hypothetical protein